MARPRKAIDPEQVARLAGIGCPVVEIAAVLDCSPDTLQRRYAAVIEKGRESANGSLRRKQFEIALAGNVGMLIWLGKQRLGQHDKMVNELTGKDGGPVEVKAIDYRTAVHALKPGDDVGE